MGTIDAGSIPGGNNQIKFTISSDILPAIETTIAPTNFKLIEKSLVGSSIYARKYLSTTGSFLHTINAVWNGTAWAKDVSATDSECFILGSDKNFRTRIKNGGVSVSPWNDASWDSDIVGSPASGAAAGDLAGTFPAPTLVTTSVTPGSYPSTGQIPVVTFDSKGRATSASSTTDGSNLSSLNASNLSTGAVPIARIPTGIPALSIGGGTVDNTELGYLEGVTSPIQTQLNDKLDSTSNKLNPTPSGTGKLIYDTGSSYAAIGTGTSGYLLQANGASAPTWTPPPASITLPLPETNGGFGTDVSSIGTGIIVKTSSNSWNTRSLGNGTGTTVTNPDGTAGPFIYVNLDFGTSSTQATRGNDTRLNPAPSTLGRVLYDSGTAWTALAAGSGVLSSNGFTPSWSLTKVGQLVTLAYLSNTSTGNLASGNYFGAYTGVPNATAANLPALIFPNAGTLSKITLQATTGATDPGGSTIFFYKAASQVASPSYSGTGASIAVATGVKFGTTATTISVSANDMILALSNAAWTTPGIVITAIFTPN